MPELTPAEGINLMPELLRLIFKVIKLSKKGWTKEERLELSQDLLALAVKVGEEALD